ncbi:hypothetical protein BC937DRAFT_86623 [Endogone sp. FLAS-F59071]|nr:hypothetical protein BC937DRAFT_86623 [Endogone sp. FLAS-F59071]|eukprot:RUS12949.1 hypothetical protein BC937DRAFT_86623 [Endogone sp. FLAS-F59071]
MDPTGGSRPNSIAYRVAFFLVILFVPLSIAFSIIIPLRFLTLPMDRWCFAGVCFGNTSYGVAFASLHFIGEALVNLWGESSLYLSLETWKNTQRKTGTQVNLLPYNYALPVAPLMLIDQILLYQPILVLHRWFGRVYLLGILAACTGGLLYILTMGPTPGGTVTSVPFALYFALLLIVASPAYHYARRRNITQHKRWAARTFALGIGPLLYAIYVAPLFLRSGSDSVTTQEVTWLGVAAWAFWVPNALVAELVIYLVWRNLPNNVSVEEHREQTPLNTTRRNADLDTFPWQHYVD